MEILAVLAPLLAASAMQAIKALLEKKGSAALDSKVEQAEKDAFTSLPAQFKEKLSSLAESQEGLQEKAQELSLLISENRETIKLGNLFNLYNKQIERYQEETRSRASWSFYIALIAMFFGFGFVFWGGQYILTETDWNHLAAGSAIAAIGGAVSAYITRTFLDVHKMSIQQLNRYFRQPVLNDHILMAQRVAESFPEHEFQKEAYKSIVLSITSLFDRRTSSEISIGGEEASVEV